MTPETAKDIAKDLMVKPILDVIKTLSNYSEDEVDLICSFISELKLDWEV